MLDILLGSLQRVVNKNISKAYYYGAFSLVGEIGCTNDCTNGCIIINIAKLSEGGKEPDLGWGGKEPSGGRDGLAEA